VWDFSGLVRCVKELYCVTVSHWPSSLTYMRKFSQLKRSCQEQNTKIGHAGRRWALEALAHHVLPDAVVVVLERGGTGLHLVAG
jgi:hypothetical protein